MEEVYIFRDEELAYPDSSCAFSPSVKYPEYLWAELSAQENNIYNAIRTMFHACGLDKKNYGTATWNPLGEYIQHGDVVLIKPNMVKHFNEIAENGTDCLYTHPSLVRAVVDYVILALNGTGRIVIADAPVQSCDFEQFCRTSGYRAIIEFYRNRGVKVEFYDLRKAIGCYEKGMVVRHRREEAYQDICVNLGPLSAFNDLSDEQLQRLRITDYSPKVMNAHHSSGKHEYSVSAVALEANVIINMPKIKTHRLAGITGALKNMVGINSNKDYLPHHRLGTPSDGGDQFRDGGCIAGIVNRIVDLENDAIEIGNYRGAKLFNLLRRGGQKYLRICGPGRCINGNWYGNDTIWRMVSDLNRITQYGDENGKICDARQRKMLIVGDMVVAGEGEGPLRPSPKYMGCMLFGSDPVSFDMAVAKLMGYALKELPVIWRNYMFHDELTALPIASNWTEWNGKRIAELESGSSFLRPSGWEDGIEHKAQN